jgi:hypothetical protein
MYKKGGTVAHKGVSITHLDLSPQALYGGAVYHPEHFAPGGEVDDMPPAPMGHNMPPEPMPQVAPAPVTSSRRQPFQFNTPEEQARPIMEAHKGTGLEFPEEDGLFRLNAKLKRERSAKEGKAVAGNPANPRTVIKAPKGLSDFIAGDLNYEDWTKRHEQILNPQEAHEASQWYARIYDTFKQYYPNANDARQHMKAWLVAQQNISPAGAMNNVLMQKEQMARNVPPELWKAGGMPNPTEAARAVLQNQPIKGGVGQKIADFVDSAEGKDVRSWMANHPDGESPFVVDVHTARDTGMVDQELINHLKRLGYDHKALDKLKIDLTGTPTEAAYENRAAWGRGLTEHLNRTNWLGKNDWRPEEAQAVGWMGMTKLTRAAEEDAESGLSRNMRRISYEIDPGEGSPWAEKYSAAISALTPKQKAELTETIAEHAMEHASKLAGIHVPSLVHGTGAWEQYQNPAAVGQSLSTQGGADIAANALGHILNQTEVWHNRVKPMTSNPKGFAVDFIERGSKNLADPKYLSGFWQNIMDADPHGLFKGFQPITLPSGEVGIRALIDKGGTKTQEKIEQAIMEGGPIHKALSAMEPDIGVMGHEAEITKHRNDWKVDKNGESYLARLVPALGSDTPARLDSIRSILEKRIEDYLKKAQGPQKGSSKKETVAEGGRIEYNTGGPVNVSKAEDTAGNFKKKHEKIHGIPVTIEVKEGHDRVKYKPNGDLKFKAKQYADYGAILGTKDADGMNTDAMVGPHKDSDKTYIIDQRKHDSGKFDEHKVMLGFNKRKKAIKAYTKSYADRHGKERVQDVVKTDIKGLKKWLKHGNLDKPASKDALIKSALSVVSKKT